MMGKIRLFEQADWPGGIAPPTREFSRRAANGGVAGAERRKKI